MSVKSNTTKRTKKLSESRRSRLGTQKEKLKDMTALRSREVGRAIAERMLPAIREEVHNQVMIETAHLRNELTLLRSQIGAGDPSDSRKPVSVPEESDGQVDYPPPKLVAEEDPYTCPKCGGHTDCFETEDRSDEFICRDCGNNERRNIRDDYEDNLSVD